MGIQYVEIEPIKKQVLNVAVKNAEDKLKTKAKKQKKSNKK